MVSSLIPVGMAVSAPAFDPLEFGRLVQSDPVWFCETVLGLHLWSKQREIIESVRDNPRTAVRSSHGVGKTTTAAAAVLWFLAAFRDEAIVLTTAPTDFQVKDLLWREIHHLRRRATVDGVPFFDGHPTERSISFGDKWFAVGRSTDSAERFQGMHSPHFLFVADEASGVSEVMFNAAEGFLTAGEPRVLMIGNPTQVGGRFYDAFHQSASMYHRIHVSTFDTPAFTGEPVPPEVAAVLPSQRYVDDYKTQCQVSDEDERGSNREAKLHPEYEIRVLGEFPSQASNAVVPLTLVEAAQRREIDTSDPENTWPLVIGCDPAGEGNDETAIVVAQGNHARVWEVIQGQDLMVTAGKMIAIARELDPHPLYGHPTLVVDEIGIGKGIVSRLREIGEFRVVAYNAAKAPAETNKSRNQREGGLGGGYPNARSELWFEFAEEALPNLDLDPNDSELLRDLCAPLYRIDSQGRRVVERKEDTKKRLGRSPDRADALMMCYSRPVTAGMFASAPTGPPVPGGVSKWQGMGAVSGRSRWR